MSFTTMLSLGVALTRRSSLIPKKKGAQELSDFRPICLINCLNKILAKVLANRLSPLMEKLISDSQGAFVKRRQLVEQVEVAHEIIHSAHSDRAPVALWKVDMEKEYDRISWSGLDYMLSKFGF